MYKETLYISHESQERVFSVEQCLFNLLCDHDPVVRKCFFYLVSAPSVFPGASPLCRLCVSPPLVRDSCTVPGNAGRGGAAAGVFCNC